MVILTLTILTTADMYLAITPGSAPSLKRRAPSPELSDSENVDPNILDSIGKRKRAAHDDDGSLSKPSRYSLHVLPPSKLQLPTPPITSRLDDGLKLNIAPLSAPPAAGRSPTKGKRMGLMQPRKRFGPPSLGKRPPSLSITAALNGTLAHKKAKKHRTIEETKPKSWFFDIFEESDEQQNYRMNEWTMTQSANILDISDDESKAREESDKGKENIDPNEIYTAPTTRSTINSRDVAVPKTSRKDAMLDEPRSPLGDLNPSEFYGEGLDATSVVLVHEDTEPHVPEPVVEAQQIEAQTTQSEADFTFEAQEKLPTQPELVVESIHSILAASEPNWDAVESTVHPDVDSDLLQGDCGPIEIWESESAKDEEEQVDTPFEEAEVGGLALQEL